jgi:hypothetical protein
MVKSMGEMCSSVEDEKYPIKVGKVMGKIRNIPTKKKRREGDGEFFCSRHTAFSFVLTLHLIINKRVCVLRDTS